LDFRCQDCILAQIFFGLQQISRTLVAFLFLDFFTTERFLLSFLIFTDVVTGYRSQPRVCFCGARSLLVPLHALETGFKCCRRCLAFVSCSRSLRTSLITN
jgi:hypothetical protein